MKNIKKFEVNQIQKLFEKYGYDLEHDNNMAELCDAICDRVRSKARTQETFFDGSVYTCTKDRINHLRIRILHEEKDVKNCTCNAQDLQPLGECVCEARFNITKH